MKTEFIQSNGIKLYTISKIISEEVPTILWVHGFAEHCQRYSDIIQFFSEKGFNSIAFDLRGHGRSEGQRAYIQNFNEYLQDLNSVRNYYEQKYPKTKWYLVGHSMGGLIVIRYHQTMLHKNHWETMVVSSPFLGVSAPVPAWKKTLSKLIVNIYPKISIPSGLNPEHISHDPKVVNDYKNDKLVLKNATAGWYEASMKAIQTAFQEIDKIQGNLHFLIAGDDKLVDANATQSFFEKIPNEKNVTLKVYPSLYHEIFNEIEKEKVWYDLLEIFNGKEYC